MDIKRHIRFQIRVSKVKLFSGNFILAYLKKKKKDTFQRKDPVIIFSAMVFLYQDTW